MRARKVVPVLGLVTVVAGACGSDGETGNWDSAADHIGETTTICGPVRSIQMDADDTFINVGKDYPDEHRFVIVVWDAGDLELGEHDGEEVCATGDLTSYSGVPQMKFRDADAIRFGANGTTQNDASVETSDASSAATAITPDRDAEGAADPLRAVSTWVDLFFDGDARACGLMESTYRDQLVGSAIQNNVVDADASCEEVVAAAAAAMAENPRGIPSVVGVELVAKRDHGAEVRVKFQNEGSEIYLARREGARWFVSGNREDR